jgi:hypothetical protein
MNPPPEISPESGSDGSDRARFRTSTRRRAWRVVAGASCALYLFLAAHSPLAILASARHDDALFVRLGQELAAGRWLGEYDHLTLIKGPGYPLFLALVSWSGLPLTIASALLHCAAAALVGVVLYRLTLSVVFARVAFLALLWLPTALSWSMLRVIRDSIYPDLVLLAVATLWYAWFAARTTTIRVATGLAGGLLLGWVWLTREEGAWLAPLLVVALLAAGAARMRSAEHRSLAAWAAILATAAGFSIPPAAYRTANYLRYGAFVGVEVTQRDFVRALAALKSVRAGADIARVPVTRAARERIYAESPSFAALRPVLDPATGPAFQSGCRYYPETCGEIAGGWFLWAVRQAAREAGRMSSPTATAGFFRQLAEEVEAACAAGRLECDRSGPALMPRVAAGQWATAPQKALTALSRAALRNLEDEPMAESSGEITATLEFLNHPAALPLDGEFPRVRLDGWFHRPDGSWFGARVRSAEGEFGEMILVRRPSPEIADHVGDPKATQNRFTAEGRCEPGCSLVFEGTGGGGRVRVEVAPLVGKGKFLRLGRGSLVIDHVYLSDPDRPEPPARFASLVLRQLRRLYSRLLAPLFALGALALAFATVRAIRDRHFGPLLLLALGAWLAALARLALLVVISLSAFPGLSYHYLPPATAMALLGSLCALRCAWIRERPMRAEPVLEGNP